MNKLDFFIGPKTIAVIGASQNKDKLGYQVLKNLLTYKGKIFPVNPKKGRILGLKVYPSVLDIKEKIDLGIICVRSTIVSSVVQECGEKGIKGLIIISAGFSEIGQKGEKLEKEILHIAQKYNIRIIGPNCLGVLYPPKNLNASFAPLLPPEGHIAFISQSGALMDGIIDRSTEKDLSFSVMISYGNGCDLDISDFITLASGDKHTKVICVYFEGIKYGRKFYNTLTQVSKTKPILYLKGGKSPLGQKTALTHTASLGSDFKILEGVLKQAGVASCSSLEEMFTLSKGFISSRKLRGKRIAIISNAGGGAVLASDYCFQQELVLPPLSKQIIAKLNYSEFVHPAWSKRNPIDLVGDASPQSYRIALREVLKCKKFDGVLVILTRQTMTKPFEIAKIIAEEYKKHKKPVVCSFIGGKPIEKAEKYLEKKGIPNFREISYAVKFLKASQSFYRYEKQN